MKSIFLRLAFLFLIVAKSLFSFAEEGMLIPSLIAAFESDMKAKGMKLSAADIYSINSTSIKDAILQFGGGCTAELVSSQGLLLTNHHCGYGQIQSHSSLEHDYLKNGFWAKTKNDELTNPGLTAMRIVRIDDVTKAVLMGASSMKIIWVKIMIPNHCLRTISFTFKSLIKMRILTINLRSRLRNRFKI